MNEGQTKSSTQETQLSSQQKELGMREKELEAKIKLDQRNIWLASPLLIGCVTAVAGLIGTGIGAILQGNATYNLERQKFEYSLIQNALKAPNQEDAAKQLVFLVDTGVINSLDSNRLRSIAKTNPGDIPYNPGTFEDGRVGRIKITNGMSDVICVKLYHPDDSHRIFSKQAIPMRDTIFLTGGPYGSDWGIQVNESKINIIGKIASWNNVDNIFSYEYKPADVTTSYSNAECKPVGF
jgi:hypothetical protein